MLPSPSERAAMPDEACYVCLFVLGILTRFAMLSHPRQVRALHRPTQARGPASLT